MKEAIISSTVLILLVCILRRLLAARANARLRYALWGLVLLRLLIPVSFAMSPVSIMSVYARSSLAGALVPVKRIELPYVERNGYVAPESDPVRQKRDAGERVPPFRMYVHEMESGEKTTEYIFLESWEDLAAKYLPPVWITGSALMAAWFLFANLRFRLRLRRSRARFEGAEDCALPVYVTGCVQSPCMTGLFRPTIYLTRDAVEHETRLRHVLAHELCHFRHGDHLWSLLRGVCLVAYWWNPLVWLAAALSRIDGELACDEGAVARLGEDARTAYGHTLLDMSLLRQGAESLLRASTSIGAGEREMRRRITALSAKRIKLTAAAVLAVCLALALTACAFLGSDSPSKEPAPGKTPAAPVDPVEQGGQKIILTYQKREGDILACQDEDGAVVCVRVNGAMSELEMRQELDEGYYIVVTYDEKDEDGDFPVIEAKTIKVGVSAEDLPPAEPLFAGSKYSMYRYQDSEISVVAGLDAENDPLLADVIMSGFLSSVVYPAVGLGSLDDCFVFVLDDCGEEGSAAKALFSGRFYYVFRQDGKAYVQTPDASMRYPLMGKDVSWEVLEALMEEKGVPFQDAVFEHTPLVPLFGEMGKFLFKVGSGSDLEADFEPYSVLQSRRTWTENGWLFADGKYVNLQEVVQYAPELKLQEQIRTTAWAGHSRWMLKELSWRLYSDALEEIPLKGSDDLSILQQPKGKYLVRIDLLLQGKYVKSEKAYEQEARSCFFWLQIP